MKIAFLGDSITHGSGTTDESRRFTNLLQAETGIECLNYGIGGTRIARQHTPSDNPVYDQLLLRYRARNFPETLTDDERTLWLHDAKQRIEGRKDSYVETLDQLAVRTGEQGRPILSALYDWSRGVFRDLGI